MKPIKILIMCCAALVIGLLVAGWMNYTGCWGDYGPPPVPKMGIILKTPTANLNAMTPVLLPTDSGQFILTNQSDFAVYFDSTNGTTPALNIYYSDLVTTKQDWDGTLVPLRMAKLPPHVMHHEWIENSSWGVARFRDKGSIKPQPCPLLNGDVLPVSMKEGEPVIDWSMLKE